MSNEKNEKFDGQTPTEEEAPKPSGRKPAGVGTTDIVKTNRLTGSKIRLCLTKVANAELHLDLKPEEGPWVLLSINPEKGEVQGYKQFSGQRPARDQYHQPWEWSDADKKLRDDGQHLTDPAKAAKKKKKALKIETSSTNPTKKGQGLTTRYRFKFEDTDTKESLGFIETSDLQTACELAEDLTIPGANWEGKKPKFAGALIFKKRAGWIEATGYPTEPPVVEEKIVDEDTEDEAEEDELAPATTG